MSQQADPVRPVPELKAAAHLVLLDPGLFCVSPAADAPAPDASGLPAVRLSPAPGGFGGRVLICGFNGEGWLGARDDAALVRVIGAPGQVLVTIYQSAQGAVEAPKLQVLRLSEPAPVAEPVGAAPVEVLAHLYGRGDVAGTFGDWIGERGSRRWVEGFALQPPAPVLASDVEYQAVLGRGWLSPWSEGGQFCGSRGMALPILGLRVRLRGAAAASHTLSVSATFVDGAEVGPVAGGEACEAPSLAALEAFQVTVQARAEPAKRRRGASA